MIVPRSSQAHNTVRYSNLQDKYLYTPVQIASLEKSISPARLSTYQKLSNGTLVDAIRIYHWNIALGQSLYLPIQNLEVSLRNTISNSIENLFGLHWYSELKFEMILTSWAKQTLKETVKKTQQKKRNRLTPGDVVANLTFGFWREMLKRHYDRHIWNKKLSVAFPYLPDTKNNQDVYNSVDQIIKLRNRISHHEPIIKKGKLRFLYVSMLEIIGWICLDTKDWASIIVISTLYIRINHNSFLRF